MTVLHHLLEHTRVKGDVTFHIHIHIHFAQASSLFRLMRLFDSAGKVEMLLCWGLGGGVHAPRAPHAELEVCVSLHFPVWGTEALCCLHREESFPAKARRKNTIAKALLIETHCHKGRGGKKPLQVTQALLAENHLPI